MVQLCVVQKYTYTIVRAKITEMLRVHGTVGLNIIFESDNPQLSVSKHFSGSVVLCNTSKSTQPSRIRKHFLRVKNFTHCKTPTRNWTEHIIDVIQQDTYQQ